MQRRRRCGEAKKRSTALKKRAELRALQILQDQQAQQQQAGVGGGQGTQGGGDRKGAAHSPKAHSLEEGGNAGRY